MPRCVPKSVVKPKIASSPVQTQQPLTPITPALSHQIDEMDSMSLDGQKHLTDGITTWDLIQKFGLWFL